MRCRTSATARPRAGAREARPPWEAPASRSNSLVPRSARRTPPPALLHRDWRVFGVEVPVDLDDKHASLDVSERLRHALAERLGLGAPPPLDDIQLVRKSLDARPRRAGGRRGKLIGGHEVAWSDVVDVKLDAADAKRLSKQQQPGRLARPQAVYKGRRGEAEQAHR